eukprot:SAG31_NODE_3863_length_3810_cov_9.181083_7_plen_64_part_00
MAMASSRDREALELLLDWAPFFGRRLRLLIVVAAVLAYVRLCMRTVSTGQLAIVERLGKFGAP